MQKTRHTVSQIRKNCSLTIYTSCAGYIIGMLAAANTINVTFQSTGYIDEDDESAYNLNLFWLLMQFSTLPNNRLTAGLKMKLVSQTTVSIMFCRNVEEMRVVKNQLDRFFTLLEYKI